MYVKFKLNSRSTVAKDIFNEFLNERIHTYFPVAKQVFANVPADIREHYVTKHDVMLTIFNKILVTANPLSSVREEIEAKLQSLITEHPLPIVGRFNLASYSNEVAKVMFENMIETGGYNYREILGSWLSFFAVNPDFCTDYEPANEKENGAVITELFNDHFDEHIRKDFVPYKSLIAGKHEITITADYAYNKLYTQFLKPCRFLPCFSRFLISKAIETFILDRRFAYVQEEDEKEATASTTMESLPSFASDTSSETATLS